MSTSLLMTETTQTRTARHALPGFDPQVAPVRGIGMSITGVMLGMRPRLSPIPLALTAVAAFFYRDPRRTTPDIPDTLFAVADGTVLGIDEIYEHRFLHTDALRIATLTMPLNVPVNRSPTAGIVRYLEQVSGTYLPIWKPEAAESNPRTYIGIETSWGPLLIVHIPGPLTPRVQHRVQLDDSLAHGERISTARFGARTDLIVQRDSLRLLVDAGAKLRAGLTPLARIIPL